MAESQFLRKLLNDRSDQPEDYPESFTTERQITGQPINLQVEKRDGKEAEGLPWLHYAGDRWSIEGDHERLVILFGERAVEIEGHNLRLLQSKICQGQLTGVRETLSAQAALSRQDDEEGPILTSIRIHPDFEEILKEIKGEDHASGFVGKVRGR